MEGGGGGGGLVQLFINIKEHSSKLLTNTATSGVCLRQKSLKTTIHRPGEQTRFAQALYFLLVTFWMGVKQMGNSAVALLRSNNIYCWHVWLKGLLVCHYCLQKRHNTWFVICCILTFLGGIWYESVFLSTLKDTSICSPFLLTPVYLSFMLSFILFSCHLFILQMEALTINFQVNKVGRLLLFCLTLDKFDFHVVLHHFYSLF